MRYDEEKFEAFYRRNFASVFWFFRRARIADDEAQELAQEVFMNAWRAWRNYRGEGDKSYLHRIALRVLLTRRRVTEARKRQMQYESADDPAVAAKLAAPPDVDTHLQRRLLRDLISGLPSLTRECVLYWIAGYSYEEIASMVQRSVDVVKTRLRDSKAILKEDYDAREK